MCGEKMKKKIAKSKKLLYSSGLQNEKEKKIRNGKNVDFAV